MMDPYLREFAEWYSFLGLHSVFLSLKPIAPSATKKLKADDLGNIRDLCIAWLCGLST